MDLCEALRLRDGALVAAVGGGGKTSLVFALAGETAARGHSAIITTTTKMTRPATAPATTIVESDDACAPARIRTAMKPGTIVLACAGRGERSRYLGFAPETVDDFGGLGAGLVSVEGDGSAHRPFKAPGDHEPVIPASATDVVVCVGLEVLGKLLDEAAVHRPERVTALSGAPRGARITADVIVDVLLHAEGGRKGVPPTARLHALLNGPETAEHQRLGEHLAARVVYGGFDTAIVATAHRSEVHAVVR